MAEGIDHQKIYGVARPVTDLFSATRQYTVEYYQREYAWTTNNVEEMLNDIARSFLSSYSESDPREKVAEYTPYFLGPIVTYTVSNKSYLVDGQQRLTTLSLLLMYLRSISEDEYQRSTLQNLVFSAQFGKEVFRINVEDRTSVMQAILRGDKKRPNDLNSSSSNIWDRYEDILSLFPEELNGDALPYFVDWLQNRVVLVEISTPDKNMALEIFESMNDRGLQLTNMDMLKSYLLSRIEDTDRIERANEVWRDCVNELREAQKNGDSEFMKTFLRAKYAVTFRETGKGTTPKHYEDIGTAFHKWVREQVDSPHQNGEDSTTLSLSSAKDFEDFILRDFQIQAKRYIKLLHVSDKFTEGWEYVRFNAMNNFTLQNMLSLAASDVDDDEETFRQKTEVIAKYLDIMIARRMANYKRRGYSMMYRPMFSLAKQIRGLNVSELTELLGARVERMEENFEALDRFTLTYMNKPDVYYLLARMTAWLEDDKTDRYFKGGSAPEPYEVEHIWANKFERHTDEFVSENEFLQYRSRFGALLLLPKSFNASYGAMPYEEKVPHYAGQNALAQTLVHGVGSNNPKLRRKAENVKAPFEPSPEKFEKKDIHSRQSLYRAICEAIWDPVSLGFYKQDED